MVINAGDNLDLVPLGQDAPCPSHPSATTPSRRPAPHGGSPPAAGGAARGRTAHDAPEPGTHPPGPATAPRRPAPAARRSVRPPPRMRPPQRQHPRPRHRAHLMRAGPRPRRPVRQPRQPAIARIPAQPGMHRLPRHPIPPGHIGHRCAHIQDFQHRPVPLPGHAQLRQHTPLPPRDHRWIAGKRPGSPKARKQHAVSRRNRNYCRAPTGTASANCRPGTGTQVSSIYRNRTRPPRHHQARTTGRERAELQQGFGSLLLRCGSRRGESNP